MKAAFLISLFVGLVLRAHCENGTISTSTSSPENDDGESEISRSEFEESFQNKVHNSLERKRLSRFRRSSPPAAGRLSSEGFFHEYSVSRAVNFEGLLPASALNNTVFDVFKHLGKLHLVVAHRAGRLQVYRFEKRFELELDHAASLPIEKVRHFIKNGRVWLVCLHMDNGKNTIRTYELTDRIVIRQTIPLDAIGDFELAVSDDDVFLSVIQIQRELDTGTTNEGEFRIFQWLQTSFARTATHPVVGATALQIFAEDDSGPLFIAIAQSLERSHPTDSLFLIYNKNRPKELRKLQSIQLFKPTKVLHYSSFGTLYVAFVTQTGVTLFWFDGMQFIEWQTLPSSENADFVQWMRLPNQEIALAVAKEGRLSFYSQDADAMYGLPTVVDTHLSQKTVTGFRLLNVETVGDICLFESSDYTPSYRLHLLKMVLKTDRETDPLTRCLNSLEAQMMRVDAIMLGIASRSKQVWQYGDLIDRPLVINGTLDTQKVPLRVRSVSLQFHPVHEPHVAARTARRVPQNEDLIKLQRETASMMDASRSFERALTLVARSDITQTWNGTYTFVKPISTENLRIGDSDIGRINDVTVEVLLTKAVRKDRDEVFNRPLSIQGEIHIDELHADAVDKVDVTDLMLKHGRQTVTGRKTFTSAVFHVGLDTPAVNRLPLNQMCLVDAEEKVSGVKKFSRLTIIDNLSLQEFNGRDIDKFLNSAIDTTSTKPIHINGNWAFSGRLEIKDLRLQRPIASRFDINHMKTSAMTLNTPQNTSGDFLFLNAVRVEGKATVRSVNRINLLKDLVTLSTLQTINVPLNIIAPIELRNAKVDRLNGIPISDFLLTRSKTTQIVKSRKTFLREIKVVKGVQMKDDVKLGGVDPSEVAKGNGPVLRVHETFRLRNLTILGSVRTWKGLNHGQNLRSLRDTVWMRSVPQILLSPVNVRGEVSFRLPVDPTTVNGVSLEKDLIHTFGNQLLTVEKFLDLDRVDCKKLRATATLINGMDLVKTVQNIVTVSGRVQHVSTPIELPELSFQGLDANFVNGHKLSEFAAKQGGDPIRGLVVLEGPVSFEHLDVLKDLSVGVLNDRNLANFLSQLVFKHNAHTRPIRNKSFVNGFSAGNLLIANATLNGIRLPSVLAGFALKDRDQVFRGKVIFKKPSSAPSLDLGFVAGHNVTLRLNNVVLSNKPYQEVTGTKTFNGPVFIKDLITPRVNGINLGNFLTYSMKKNGHQNVFKNSVNFQNGFETTHLTVRKKISGVDLKKMIPITSKENLRFPGGIKFRKIFAGGDLQTSGLVNGVNFTRLNTDALRSFSLEPQVIHSPVRFHSLRCDRGVRLSRANGIVMKDFIGALKDTSLGNVIHNGSLVVPHPIEVRLLLHNETISWEGAGDIHLDKILEDAVYTNQRQVITAPKFARSLSVAKIRGEKASNMFVSGKLNGFDPKQLSTLVNSRNRVVTAPKTFGSLRASRVVLNGPINGISLQRDLILSKNTEIRIPIRTSSLRVERGLHIDNVNGHSVPLFMQIHNSREIFDGTIRIKVPLLRVDALHAMSVNGIDRRDFVFTDEERPLISGRKTFIGPVTIEGDIVDSRDGYSASLRTVACPDVPEVLGSLRFSGSVITPALNAEKLDGLSQPREVQEALLSEVAGKARELESKSILLQDSKHQTDESIRRIKPAFEEFVEVQKISTGRSPVVSISTAPSETSSTISVPWVQTTSLTVHVPTTRHCSRGVCCDQLDTLMYTVDGHGLLQGPPQVTANKRIFGMSDTSNGRLSIVTNTSSTSMACAPAIPETTEVFQTSPSKVRGNSRFPAFSDTESAYLINALPFSFQRRSFVLLAYGFSKHGSSRPGLQILERSPSGLFKKIAFEPLDNIAAVDVISTSDTVFIAAATRWSPRREQTAKIYKMYRGARGGFELSGETVVTHHVSDVKFMAIHHDGTLLCVFANEHSIVRGHSAYTEPVSVLRYDPIRKSFSETRFIPVYGATSLATFSYHGQDFLAIASPHEGTLSVWQWVGFPEFVQIVTMEVPTRHIHAYWAAEEGGLMLAASDSAGSLRILRSVWSGFCPRMLQYARYQPPLPEDRRREHTAWINQDIRTHNQGRYWPRISHQNGPVNSTSMDGEGVREDSSIDSTSDASANLSNVPKEGKTGQPGELDRWRDRERVPPGNAQLPEDSKLVRNGLRSSPKDRVVPIKKYFLRLRTSATEEGMTVGNTSAGSGGS